MLLVEGYLWHLYTRVVLSLFFPNRTSSDKAMEQKCSQILVKTEEETPSKLKFVVPADLNVIQPVVL